ncbi:hypothetical protein LOC67_26680 [Stieleria sp. JC731]|uniref:hypothetical protein n=1 Tax=Pirellulaceae TaxID=2691357 RepID=UPI001E3D65B1|nr:hypothetical protein [Stieleria sp. JC731]MCC9604155.1 hypothetical protein [Stieleria sp. JC731]
MPKLDPQTRLQNSDSQAAEIDFEVRASESAQRLLDQASTIAVVSSHLGRSLPLHQHVCRYLTLAMLHARITEQVLLVAEGSAIETWAIRAAETFRVPFVKVSLNGSINHRDRLGRPSPWIHVSCDKQLGRDQVLINMADRVDCVFVRAGGTIESVLRQRLIENQDATVRIASPLAVHPQSRRSYEQLLELGAVGWYCPPANQSGRVVSESSNESDAFAKAEVLGSEACDLASDKTAERELRWCTEDDGQWLVHCTRSCVGPWPGESVSQYQDWMLLNDSHQTNHYRGSCLGTLQRILKMQRLVGSALTSHQAFPVVCFSACPLAGLLSQRCYRPHLHRWDYEPYGIAIRKSAAVDLGCKPVIYGGASVRDDLPGEQLFRFQAQGKTYDWTSEYEWRFSGDVDLTQFDHDDIRVFVSNQSDKDALRTDFKTSVVASLLA